MNHIISFKTLSSIYKLLKYMNNIKLTQTSDAMHLAQGCN